MNDEIQRAIDNVIKALPPPLPLYLKAYQKKRFELIPIEYWDFIMSLDALQYTAAEASNQEKANQPAPRLTAAHGAK